MDNDLTIQLNVLSKGVDKINAASGAINNLDKASKTASQRMSDFGKKMESTGSRINVLGQRMTWGVTAPLLLLANQSIKTALEVDRAWVRMKKVFDGSAEDLAYLKEAAWDMSTTYGIAFEESAEALTEFSKAGITSREELAALGQLTAETAILFDSNMNEALTGVKSIMFGFGLTVEQTAQELSAINIIADKTTASEKGVMEMLSKVAGTARAADFSIRGVAAAQAVFEANAIPAGRAGNAMKSILTSLTKQSNLAKDQFADLGVSMTDVEWKTSSGMDKLEKLAKKLAELKSVGDEATLKKFNQQVGDMSEALGNMDEGPIEKLKLLKAALVEAEIAGDQTKLDAIKKELDSLNIGGADASENIEIMIQRLTDLEKTGRTVELHQANEALASLVGKFQINNLNVLLQDLAKNFDDSEETVSIFYDALSKGEKDLVNATFKGKQLEEVMNSSSVKVAALEQAYKKQASILGDELLPYKIKLMEFLTGLLDRFNKLSPETQQWIFKIGILAATLGPLLSMVGLAVTGLGFLLSGIGSVSGALGKIVLKMLPFTKSLQGAAGAAGTTASKGLSGAMGVNVLGALVAVTGYIITEAIISYNKLQDTLESLSKTYEENKDRIDRNAQAIKEYPDGEFKEKLEGINEKAIKHNEEMKKMQERYEGLPGAFNAVLDQLDTWYDSFEDWAVDTESWFGKVADKAWEAYQNIRKAQKEGGGGGGSFAMGGVVNKAGGGPVYAAQGFFPKGRDTVPAMLSPGEMVLNRSQQANLFNIISGKSQLAGGGGATVNINVNGNMIASRGEQREFARKIKELLEEDSNRY